MTNMLEIRSRSSQRLANYRISVAQHLPLLETPVLERKVKDVIGRALCLSAVLSRAYGIPKKTVNAWLVRNNLSPYLTPTEERALISKPKYITRLQYNVERLYILAWSLSLYDDINIGDLLPENLSDLVPNPCSDDDITLFSKRTRLRPIETLVQLCDTSYCLHWAVRNAQLERKPSTLQIESYVVEERRVASEWLVYDIDWDNPHLDT